MLSLKPRTEATRHHYFTDPYTGYMYSMETTFKVDERITTLSYEAHVKYTNKDWFIGAKSVLGSNLTQASGLGGFGIKSVNEQTGEQEYTFLQLLVQRCLRTEMEAGNLRRLCQESGNK